MLPSLVSELCIKDVTCSYICPLRNICPWLKLYNSYTAKSQSVSYLGMLGDNVLVICYTQETNGGLRGRREKISTHEGSCSRDFFPPREFSSPREISSYREFSLCNVCILEPWGTRISIHSVDAFIKAHGHMS